MNKSESLIARVLLLENIIVDFDEADPTTPGATFTKTITRGPNKGDKVMFKVAKGGKPFPIRVLKDEGDDSTLRDNGIPFGKKKK